MSTRQERFKVNLRINKKSVELNPFVEEFLARTTIGAAASLRGVEEIQSLEIHQEKDDVTVTVNGEEIPLTPFPRDIIANTLSGMVSPLKGVDDIDSLYISVKVE
jgi:hypothetical protein